MSHKIPAVVSTALSQDLKFISTWIEENNLSMNVSKTPLVLLSRKTKNESVRDVEVSIDGEVIKKQDTVKYLRVIVDHQLTWKHHIARQEEMPR